MTKQPARKGPGYYRRLAEEDAARRGLTAEEYGVYKGSVGSVVKPISSATGLLVISIVLTVICLGLVALVGVAIAQDLGYLPRQANYTPLSPVMNFFLLVTLVFPFWSWSYYRKERRAQKLRESRGLPRNLG